MYIHEIVEDCEDCPYKISYLNEKGSKRFTLTKDLDQFRAYYPELQFTIVPGIKELAHLLYTVIQCQELSIEVDATRTIEEFNKRFPDVLLSKSRTRNEIQEFLDGRRSLNRCIEDYI